MGQWICIDHGDKRIGLAAGSTEQGIASPLKVIPAEPHDDAVAAIKTTAADYNADGLVVGWPLNMDDSEGPQGKVARAFAAELAEATGMDVRMWDETLSSFAADGRLAGHLTKQKRKRRRDAAAAAAILEDFLRRDGPIDAPSPDQTD
ncbi:hypothetical protein LCGC14_2960530 [marine sediment metagenome]|uniref:YqgF/RNase H-like domain-containing protein n=1 Tax=marine sediment metagenome TaxID=412755 RepID=A0A0F8XC82_9ZZZZ